MQHGLLSKLIKGAWSWAMFPVYVWQGIGVRMRIERMLPAPVPQSGSFDGSGVPIKLLILGDSTVDSVGMERLEDTFAFNIARAVNERSGQPVQWRAAGGNSSTSRHIRDYVLPHIEPRDWTHIALSIGINDMKNFHAVRGFKRDFGTLLYALRARFPTAKIVWCPIPDMRDCPALPEMLGRVLAARAELINDMGRRMCRERRATATGAVPKQPADAFARDGFHPGPKGYRIWGRHFARWIAPDAERADAEQDDKSGDGVTPLRRSA